MVSPLHSTRSHALPQVETDPASSLYYPLGAGLVLGQAAAHTGQLLMDGAYKSLPPALQLAEAGLSSRLGQTSVLQQSHARSEALRQNLNEIRANPAGVPLKAALNIWNAFKYNDGSAQGKLRAGAAIGHIALLAAPFTPLLKHFWPERHLNAEALKLGAGYEANVWLTPTKSSRKGSPTWAASFENIRKHNHTPNSTGDIRSAINALKQEAAKLGAHELVIYGSFSNPRLAELFKKRYPQTRFATPEMHRGAFRGIPTRERHELIPFLTRLPLDPKWIAQASTQLNRAPWAAMWGGHALMWSNPWQPTAAAQIQAQRLEERMTLVWEGDVE